MERRVRHRLFVGALSLTSAAVFLGSGASASEPPLSGVVVSDRGIEVRSLPEQKVPGPSRANGTFTARILVKTPIRRRPGKRAVWVARTKTKWSGASQKLMVLGSRQVDGKMWLKVRLPIRPNGSSGWLPRDRVILGHSPYFIVIDTSRRRLSLYRSRHRVAGWRVVVGAPATPTPTGLFALYDRVRQRDPHGFIGPWAIPLTAHSNQLQRFDGGPGLVALHGRDGASLLDPLGSAASHGCVRMNNSRVRILIGKSIGTAVKIRR